MSFSTFPSVYLASRSQGYGFGLKRKTDKRQERKRKETGDNEPESAEDDESDADAERSTSLQHPVSLKDPYHVAGWSREQDLPPDPFPRRAVKEDTTNVPIADELAALKPPIFNAPRTTGNELFSLKHRTYDNLTAIFHTCVLRNDWDRAYRAWSLMIRIPIAKESLALRLYDRWAMAAESLIRRRYNDAPPTTAAETERSIDEDMELEDGPPTVAEPSSRGRNADEISVGGLYAARNFYRRLILQYPANDLNATDKMTAMVVNPCMFNVWLYAVQLRSNQARNQLRTQVAELTDTEMLSAERAIREQELEEGNEILQELQLLLQKPMYDNITALLRLKAMTQLWLSDLYSMLAQLIIELEEQDQLDLMTEDGIRHYPDEAEDVLDKSRLLRAEADKYFSEMNNT